eukprot:COSAG01_NODE_55241_length_326_cov_1.281938_1_plen_71_part_01
MADPRGTAGRYLDERLALGETGRLVADSARSHRERLAGLEERYHLGDRGRAARDKTVAVVRVSWARQLSVS